MCAIGLFLIFGAANSVAFAMDMQIIEPWYAHLGQAFVGVLLTLPYLVGRRRKAWLR
nr:MAG TPA: hypothetical protein [Caudoviricetes sp.]